MASSARSRNSFDSSGDVSAVVATVTASVFRALESPVDDDATDLS